MKASRYLAVAVLALAGTGLLATPASAAPSGQDSTWMVAAHQSNLAEIAAGEAAGKQATSQSVKDLGAMFIDMHKTLDASLTAGATTLGVTLPGAPTPAQQAALAAVTAQSGTAFDTAWIAQQTAGHKETLAGTQTEVASGSDAAVLTLAKTALPVIQDHLVSLQKLGGSPSAVGAGTGGQAASTVPQTSSAVRGLSIAGALLLAMAGVWTVLRRRQV